MFDNPQEQLKELEDQLLAAEQPKDEKFERLYAELLEEYGPEQQQPQDDMVYRNYANSYGTQTAQPQSAPQSTPVQRTAPQPAAESYSDAHTEFSPNRSIKRLIIAICIELLAIAGLAAWWALRILTVL